MWIATHTISIVAITSALIACIMARQPSPWRNLAVINALLLAELQLGLRHRLHGLANQALRLIGAYDGRQTTQLVLVTLLAIVAITLFIFARRAASGPARIAIISTGLLVLLFMLETVSLHAIDAVIYRVVGQMTLISWLRTALAFITAGAAVAGRKSSGRAKRR